ncbi:hypothetical protein JG688_00017250 [Phytophthora aleatoria]|uniref:Uncharacterized protein n=1 Tax=Phytophthora aleatoria TaxID=2496075 RepID=A0A8J5ICS3_9STRA|nr:hypothetical protein JG688_00017250 [Phytophthora aleatoria]
MIWGALKNRIALDPAASLDDLGDKIGEGLAAITKQEWIGAYKKVQRQETAYIEEAHAAAPKTTPALTREGLNALAAEPTDEFDIPMNFSYEISF